MSMDGSEDRDKSELLPGQATPAGTRAFRDRQSGLAEDPYFADQAALWLGNEALDIPFFPEDVAAQGTGRELFLPTQGGVDCAH